MEYNNEFEKIDNELKAYFLGLLFSDGYIGSTNNLCGINLHIEDGYILKELHKTFGFFIYRERKDFSLLEVANKKLKMDLEKHGLVSQKSFQNKELLKFPDISEELIHHFIRGYFDGDGSVYKQKLYNIKCEIGSVCYPFISFLLKKLYDKGINFNMICSFKGKGLRTMDFYKIYSSSYRVSKLFADYIYLNSTISLKRKKDRFYVEVLYDKMERLICPRCESRDTTFNGVRNNKNRIFCKNCNKGSSITALVSSNINNGEDELLED